MVKEKITSNCDKSGLDDFHSHLEVRKGIMTTDQKQTDLQTPHLIHLFLRPSEKQDISPNLTNGPMIIQSNQTFDQKQSRQTDIKQLVQMNIRPNLKRFYLIF